VAGATLLKCDSYDFRKNNALCGITTF